MLCFDVPHIAVLCFAVSCYALVDFAVLCFVVPCDALVCFAVLFCAVLLNAPTAMMHYYIVLCRGMLWLCAALVNS